jgi:hypothetical protein
MRCKRLPKEKSMRIKPSEAPFRRSNEKDIGSPFNNILRLQREIGNRAVTQLMKPCLRKPDQGKPVEHSSQLALIQKGVPPQGPAVEFNFSDHKKRIAPQFNRTTKQGDVSPWPHVQRHTIAAPQPSGAAGPCGPNHAQAISSAVREAENWRGSALSWFDQHLEHIRRRVPPIAGRYGRVGGTILRDLHFLNRHFGISRVVQDRIRLYPRSPDERMDARGFEILANASSEVRRRYRNVEIQGLNYDCQGGLPPQNDGADWVGSAVPGSREFRIYTTSFDAQQPQGQIGTVLHEAFHASFTDFDHDTYSNRSGYPGASPITNADSYSNFASIVATGQTFRIIRLPAVRITGSP